MKKSIVHKLAIISVGVFVMGIATHFFLAPYSHAIGGVSGQAIILNHVVPEIPVGVSLMIGNVGLFIVGLILLGGQFGLLTLYGTIGFSLSTMFLERIFPMEQPLTANPLVSLFVGSALNAAAMGSIFMQNASTGGTDILAKLLNKYIHISIANGLFLVDSIVVILSAIFVSLEGGLYAIIGIYLQSTLMGQVIAGADRRIVMTIITKKYEEVTQYIHNDMNRGSTLYQAIGGYSGNPQMVIMTVVHRNEYIRIKDFVNRIDHHAFVYINSASEVLGEGFTTVEQEKPKHETGNYAEIRD